MLWLLLRYALLLLLLLLVLMLVLYMVQLCYAVIENNWRCLSLEHRHASICIRLYKKCRCFFLLYQWLRET